MHGEITLQGFLIKKKNEISSTKAEQIRNYSISAQVNASIKSAILGSGSIDDIKYSISSGFKQGNAQIENIKNSVEYKTEYFQYGDPESIVRINDIENSIEFEKWIDEYAINEIKKSLTQNI